MPRKERGRRFGGVLYIAVAAVAGALIGMAFGSRYVTLAIIVGALLGEFAYLKTPRGRAGGFSFSEFYKYFCSEALNIIVTVAQLRLIVEGAVS